MDCAIYGIRVDRFEIRLILSRLVSNPAVGVKQDKLILISLILNKNRIIDQILILQKQFSVRSVSTCTAAFRGIVIQSLIYFGV